MYENSENMFAALVPSFESMAHLWCPPQQAIALPPGYQLKLDRPNDACNVVVLLLSTIPEISLPQKILHGGHGVQLTVSWTLDASNRVAACYSRMSKQRYLDRRKIIRTLTKVLSKICDQQLAQYCIQAWSDLLTKVASWLDSSEDEDVQLNLAKCLLFARNWKTSSRKAEHGEDSLISILSHILSNADLWSKLIVDFQNAAKLYLSSFRGTIRLPLEVESRLNMSELDKIQPFMTDVMQEVFHATTTFKQPLILGEMERGPLTKKLKVDDGSHEDQSIECDLTRKILFLLDLPSTLSLESLSGIGLEKFDAISEPDAAQILDLLNRVPCALSRTLSHRSMSPKSSKCTVCDIWNRQRWTLSMWHTEVLSGEAQDALRAFLCMLTESKMIKSSRRLRILLVLAINNFVNHASDKKYQNLAIDPLGQYCMKSLQSSIRELRLSSSRTIMSFLRDHIPESLKHQNYSTIFKLLKMLNMRNNLQLKETIVVTWGHIGRIGGDDELNLALIELVNALGDPHPILYGVAFNEIRQVATCLEKDPLDLLSPFWRSIAPGLVKDVLVRPQKIQLLSDLLGLKAGVDELLMITQLETIPFLIITKEYDVLQRIANARGAESIQEMIMASGRILASVLSKLLLECSGSIRVAESILQETVPSLKSRFVNVIRLEASTTACEILKAAAEGYECSKVKSP
jgi:serine/threonine-protein kinase ATR